MNKPITIVAIANRSKAGFKRAFKGIPDGFFGREVQTMLLDSSWSTDTDSLASIAAEGADLILVEEHLFTPRGSDGYAIAAGLDIPTILYTNDYTSHSTHSTNGGGDLSVRLKTPKAKLQRRQGSDRNYTVTDFDMELAASKLEHVDALIGMGAFPRGDQYEVMRRVLQREYLGHGMFRLNRYDENAKERNFMSTLPMKFFWDPINEEGQTILAEHKAKGFKDLPRAMRYNPQVRELVHLE